jgi:xanthine dehydrogenase molybdopterin-binding subunit B
MLRSAPGSVDGIRVSMFEADKEYDLTATSGARDLAVAFVDAGFAEESRAKPVSVPEVAPAGVPADESAPVKPGRKPKAQ